MVAYMLHGGNGAPVQLEGRSAVLMLSPRDAMLGGSIKLSGL